jgi:predicted ATPase/class 3 adenylate cyclase
MSPERDLPTGTVTFLFTDIEGSTLMLQELGPRWREVLEEHNRILRDAIRAAGGVDIRTDGDAFFAVFRSAPAAVAASAAAQRALSAHRWPLPVRVRMGIHTGEGELGGDEYVGIDVHRAARIGAAAHGGQVLLSSASRSLVEGALPDGVSLRDLGSHRLKDLPRDERLHQLAIEGLPADYPSPRTLDTPTNLPPQRTGFVGRTRELRQVRRLVLERRLVTLTGPGGTGKTRLAVEAAAGLVERFSDGVFFVELAPLIDPTLVPAAISRACHVPQEGARSVEDTLVDHLRHRSVLLVLDNFENVVDAASLVALVIDQCAGLRVLATSRIPLRLSGEQEVPVPPLALPDLTADPRSLRASDAVELFVQRASSVDPAFTLSDANARDIAEIAARLDGLPLAIELAAARVKVFPPRSMCERLESRLPLLTGGPRDLPERQRTLRGAIGWSYELLAAPERALFRRLCVFVGGWNFEDADLVANPGGEVCEDTVESMHRLMEHSLVRRVGETADGPRFAMLETIREFGLERLVEEDDAPTIRRRHAERHQALAGEAAAGLTGPEGGRWGRVLDREHDNLRAALAWSIEAGEPDLGLEIGSALWRFWQTRGHLTEGRRWMVAILAIAGTRRSASAIRGLYAAGSLAYWQNDLEEAAHRYREGLALARDLTDPVLIAEGLYNLGYAVGALGQPQEARRQFEEAKEMFEAVGDRRMAGHVLTGLSTASTQEGNHERALAYLHEAGQRFREAGDRWGLVLISGMTAQVYVDQVRYPEARAAILESFERATEMEETLGKAVAVDALAAIESREGNHRAALVLAGAADRLRELGQGRAPTVLVLHDDVRSAARSSQLGEDEIDAAFEEGRTMTMTEMERYVRAGPGGSDRSGARR